MGSESKSPRLRRLTVELLEARCLLSAAPPVAVPLATVISRSAAITDPTIVGYTPSQISSAYGFNQISSFSTQSGSEPANGSGQTIAIVDAYNDPNIASDLAVFDSTFGIAAPPSFKIVSETGSSKLPATNPGWDTEISLDVEWAHAIAPGANILLVETTSDRWSDLIAGVDYAKNQAGVSVVSMSWDVPEYRVEAATDSTFTTAANHPVTFVAAAGDYGSPPLYPSTSPNVLSVGGTTLNLSGSSYSSETAWSDGGGGVSMIEKEPAFQDGAQNSGYRSAPDVAYDADPNTGFAVYDTIDDRYGTGWQEIAGTSAGAPQWAALIAIADEGLSAAGKPALAQAQQRLYSLPANAFHDITSGSNGTYSAGVGYDAVTGLGTPVANVLVSDLVNGTTGSPTGLTHLARISFGAAVGGVGAVRYTDATFQPIAPADTESQSVAAPPPVFAQEITNESPDGPAPRGELPQPPSAVSRTPLTSGDAADATSSAPSDELLLASTSDPDLFAP
jgi:subtilase family serine protease